ncbi:MAG TPA: hypothetical protein VFG86_13515 [Chloroflexota bacterium]|nr:hypothetical protein [Chloroflexota bacterium]
MRLLRVAWLLIAAALIQACLVVSLHPVYSAETIAFDAALVGNWVGDEESATVTFERAEWLSYHLVFTDSGKTTRLSGRLTRVGDLQLLDVSPLDGTDIPDLQIPVHGIYKIAIDGDTLSAAALNYDHFFAMAKAGKTDAGLVLDARKNAVLTASTPDLRQWLQAHETDEGLFDAPMVFRRKVGETVP